jgi:hypothetical protein
LPLRQGEPLTVEVWAAPRSRPVAGISRYVWSLAGRLELRQTADAWAWSSWDGDRVDLIRFEDGVQLNHPVHLAGVSTGQELLFFVAGRLVGRQAITAQVGDSDQVPGMGGSKHDVKHYQSFDGTIHSLRISSAARYLLSFDPPAQFQTDRDTLAVYLFGEGTGDVLRDSSGHGRHGAIAGARWVELRSPLDHGITNRVRESGETVP